MTETPPCHPFKLRADPAAPSKLLSQALDQKQRAARREDSVGPFQLGLSPQSFNGDVKVKKWSELSTGGKAARATARTTNFTVILLGAGLTAVLGYALTSELFSKNSPTVLYSEACEKIKSSPRVSRYLQGPLVFHNNPPSTTRPRHRNRHVSSQIAVDSSGREHMLLNFYVQARPSGADDTSYIDSAVSWTKEAASALPDLTLDDTVSWTKNQTEQAKYWAKELFHYLTGDPVPPKGVALDSVTSGKRQDHKQQEEKRGYWGSFTGLFGSIKGSSRSGGTEIADSSSSKLWQEGEVHADLVRDDSGYFRFRYIIVDIPNSRSRNPTRVFVEKSDDVRENEPVMSRRVGLYCRALVICAANPSTS
ncbi:hypothetical protein EWM64_g6578 [Hericium alpestre]|uniref:Mitochondrial import inner membrane translocase subunit Tim21 n=1 Tax=Hericium alpestre TaxID=135208 RepID=A0A4Y9ZTT8_9AGAM|nr:hypothetical protein EWM64_g6578 [Hericium alpestre]